MTSKKAAMGFVLLALVAAGVAGASTGQLSALVEIATQITALLGG